MKWCDFLKGDKIITAVIIIKQNSIIQLTKKNIIIISPWYKANDLLKPMAFIFHAFCTNHFDCKLLLQREQKKYIFTFYSVDYSIQFSSHFPEYSV